jgi:hypothetical protein
MIVEARTIQSMCLVMTQRRDFNHHAESGLLLFDHSHSPTLQFTYYHLSLSNKYCCADSDELEEG